MEVIDELWAEFWINLLSFVPSNKAVNNETIEMACSLLVLLRYSSAGEPIRASTRNPLLKKSLWWCVDEVVLVEIKTAPTFYANEGEVASEVYHNIEN